MPLARFWKGLALALLLFPLCSPALAEKADRDKPIQLEADRVTVDDAKQITTFEGNVSFIQGTLLIRGNRIVVRQDAQGQYQGTVHGAPASFRQKREGLDEYVEGYGNRMEYDARTEKVQFFEQAYLKRGQDEIRGNQITYDAATEFFRVAGGKESASPDNPQGRVRAIIQPKPKTPPPAAPPVSLKPAENIVPSRE